MWSFFPGFLSKHEMLWSRILKDRSGVILNQKETGELSGSLSLCRSRSKRPAVSWKFCPVVWQRRHLPGLLAGRIIPTKHYPTLTQSFLGVGLLHKHLFLHSSIPLPNWVSSCSFTEGHGYF